MGRVAVLGGGIGGLTAAHELIERGFEVDVYEASDDVGGKARQQDLPGTAAGIAGRGLRLRGAWAAEVVVVQQAGQNASDNRGLARARGPLHQREHVLGVARVQRSANCLHLHLAVCTCVMYM